MDQGFDAGWHEVAEEVMAGMKAWRIEHPQATPSMRSAARHGDRVYGDEDVIVFALASGSPSLVTLGASAADLLRSNDLRVVARAASLGLASGDDLDALNCTGSVPNEGGAIELFLPGLNKQ